MTVNVSDRMFRKKRVKSMSGDTIDLYDELHGGWIIKRGQVVNPERYEEILKEEEDRRVAAMAQAEAISAPPEAVEARTGQPGRVDALEKKVEDMDGKLDAILKALNKP